MDDDDRPDVYGRWVNSKETNHWYRSTWCGVAPLQHEPVVDEAELDAIDAAWADLWPTGEETP